MHPVWNAGASSKEKLNFVSAATFHTGNIHRVYHPTCLSTPLKVKKRLGTPKNEKLPNGEVFAVFLMQSFALWHSQSNIAYFAKNASPVEVTSKRTSSSNEASNPR